MHVWVNTTARRRRRRNLAEAELALPAVAARSIEMGATTSAPYLPASTASLCVLPLRTNGQSRFSMPAPTPMPAPVATRLGENEWRMLVESINGALLPLSHFGFMSLLLPFLFVDLLTMMLLCAIDPWLLITPWDYAFSELLLPISLEFLLVFCGFPLMVHIVNRQMATVQSRVHALLDTASHQFGARGVNFQLKQSIMGNGAGTNMWVEVQVMPLAQMFVPVPVPAPSLYPILLPAATPGGAATPGAAPAAPASGSGGAEAAAAAAAAAGANGTMNPLQLEYLRVLQENQMLRQYLKQHQTLVQLQAQHSRLLAQQVAGAASAPQPPAAATCSGAAADAHAAAAAAGLVPGLPVDLNLGAGA